MSLWDELGADAGRVGIPGDPELEAPPTLHPVPLEHARDAEAGETVTARTPDGRFRDLVLYTPEPQPPLRGDEVPEEFRAGPVGLVCARTLWVHHGDHPEVFPKIAQPWPLGDLWVWREAAAPTPDAEVPGGWDWMRRALSRTDSPTPRAPLRVQDAGPLTGREVTVRDLTGSEPGPWYVEVAVGEIEDTPGGFVVPCQTVQAHARAELGLGSEGRAAHWPVHRVWARV